MEPAINAHVDPDAGRAAAAPMPWLHDEFVETYLAWRDASVDVRAAYDCWRTAGRPDTALAFWAYHAALDREERAARAYCGSAARLRATWPW